ncbi:unnamed protein product [Adineta steineri]|uniref:Uncharacterized protein n=1 Tax=Adineta steineri TaxID=433720 RepID=A0A818U6B6_9BILA|nr:unnamed protein product [Adineta steineri]
MSNDNVKVKHVVTLFEEVQNRYVNKLLSINEKHLTSDERYKHKIVIYESYIKDLSLQTRLLLQSLEELEKEANQRVGLLENKLKKAHASLQHSLPSNDISKPIDNFEPEKWKIIHENLDLKHDMDCLVSFINIAKRTGKWNTKQLQLKTLPLDNIIGTTNDKINHHSSSLHKEIQYRDDHMQVLQAEIQYLRKTQAELSKPISSINENEFKEKNLVLSKKTDDLRSKLAEECQKTETLKMDIRIKTTELKDLQEDLNKKKKQYEEHIHDLSTKLKTISDRHRESTTIINNDNKIKKQEIEQLTKQVEQIATERSELHRQCCVKDTIIADLQVKIHNVEQQFIINNHPVTPIELTVSRIEYEKLNQELHITRKQLDETMTEIKTTDTLNNKLEQDLRLFKKFHDEQFEQQIKTNALYIDQLQNEIQTLKHNYQEKLDEVDKKSFELRTCQDRLSIEHNKNEQEQQQLRNLLENSTEKLEKSYIDIKQNTLKIDQFEKTINELNSRNNLLERKLIETMSLIDQRNKILIDNEEKLEKIQNDLLEKQKEIMDGQSEIEQLKQNLINKTAAVIQLTEKLETDLVKHQEKDKLAEDNATKSSTDIKILQRELRHLSESLIEYERRNTILNEQVQQLTNELRLKQEEFQQIEKSLNQKLLIKQDQLVQYDKNLHEIDIKCKYAKEECLIQEKEITRLNIVQEEQENKIKILQEDLLKCQEQRDTITDQYERCETDYQNLKCHREDENRQYNQEFEKLNNELTALKIIEITLLKNIDELKENLLIISNERDDIRKQYNNYQYDLENIQKILADETESNLKSETKVILLTRQFDEEQKRSNEFKYQFNDIQMQLTSALLSNDTLKTELNQARLLNQEYTIKEKDFKQNINRINSLLDERNKSLEERQREIETLNHLMSHLQEDYEKSKNNLSIAQDRIVYLEIENETIKQRCIEKTNELTFMTNQLQQSQQDFHTYEKEHRYSNEEYFEYEQRKKSLDNELSTVVQNYEKLQKEHEVLNELLNKCRCELEQNEKSNIVHKERLIQSTDEVKIYKQKLALLGDCFKTIVRKASESSEQWADITAHLDEYLLDLNDDVDKLYLFDERFEQSIKISTQLRGQYEDLVEQFLSLKTNVERLHFHIHKYKQKWLQMNDENRHLRIETKHLRDKIENFHRIHAKNDEQEIILGQIRKELNYESQTRLETQRTIEQLKYTLDETTFERNQLMKNITIAHEKIEKFEHDISEYTNENHLLQETIQKLEKQLHIQNESLEQNEQYYQEKINECESLLISLTETNNNSLHSLEHKTSELNTARTEIQTLKYEQTSTVSKLEKFEETNQEFKRHVSILERSIEEHKQLLRTREKELEQIKDEFEHTMLNSTPLNSNCAKQDTEISVLRMENASLNEELRLIRENLTHYHEEQRRARNDFNATLNLIQDSNSDICLNSDNNNNSNEILQTCIVQHVIDDTENLKLNDSLWFPLVQDGFTYEFNDPSNNQKKYKLMKAYSKQQQVLLNQLQAHVKFYESIFEQRYLPAIQYSTTSDIIDNDTQCNKDSL